MTCEQKNKKKKKVKKVLNKFKECNKNELTLK